MIVRIGLTEGGRGPQSGAKERVAMVVGLLEGQYFGGREQSRWKRCGLASCWCFAKQNLGYVLATGFVPFKA